jgi:hypothetical protein
MDYVTVDNYYNTCYGSSGFHSNITGTLLIDGIDAGIKHFKLSRFFFAIIKIIRVYSKLHYR